MNNVKDIVKELIRKKENVILLDVRDKDEYCDYSIKGSTNIPLSDINQSVYDILPNKDSIIVLYCQSGKRSLTAEGNLRKLGYNNIYNIGSINDLDSIMN
ncbi:Thiosulfate sulfurtransferase PspE precursor [compost metagenome]